MPKIGLSFLVIILIFFGGYIKKRKNTCTSLIEIIYKQQEGLQFLITLNYIKATKYYFSGGFQISNYNFDFQSIVRVGQKLSN